MEEKPYTLDDLSRARREAEKQAHGDDHKWARLRLTVVECNLAARELLQRAWPPILVMLGLVATFAWVALLGHFLMEAARAL